jgi:putative glutathione S-transferase
VGRLENGVWKKESVNPKTKDGEYKRQEQEFRDELGEKFPPEPNRYHLYVSYACPWAHRVLIMRSLKGLEDVISCSVVSPWMLEEGWEFDPDYLHSTPDDLHHKKYLRELYTLAAPEFSGRVTVPVLWDKKTNSIVNNESEDLIRIINSSFNAFATKNQDLDVFPENLQEEIKEVNELVYHQINNGVYKTGFARTQKAYEHNYFPLFEALESLEARLEGQEYLVQGQFTEADIRLYTTLVRFDAVYYSHFKCNKKRIKDLPNLCSLTKRIHQIPEIKSTFFLDHIKTHYYGSHESLNPTRIIPVGPELHLEA